MNKTEFNNLAEAHWEYSKGVIERSMAMSMTAEEVLELCGYLYVKAMVHGYKHSVDKHKKR